MTVRLGLSVVVVFGVLASVGGVSHWAFATAEGGACRAYTVEINQTPYTDPPTAPQWVLVSVICSGPCVNPVYGNGVCHMDPQNYIPIIQNGMLVGHSVSCSCTYTSSTGLIDKTWDPTGSVECQPNVTVNVFGVVSGYTCPQGPCPMPCDLLEDPAATHGTMEWPPGNGTWKETRSRTCRCP